MQAIVKMLVKCEVAWYADNSFCCWLLVFLRFVSGVVGRQDYSRNKCMSKV